MIGWKTALFVGVGGLVALTSGCGESEYRCAQGYCCEKQADGQLIARKGKMKAELISHDRSTGTTELSYTTEMGRVEALKAIRACEGAFKKQDE